MKYKYIFNVEGNAQAYRFSNEFRKGGVVIAIQEKDPFRMWFEPMLIKDYHYVVVDAKNMLADVPKKIEYLREHDKDAENIAMNGVHFALSYINRDMIIDYWYSFMCMLSSKQR